MYCLSEWVGSQSKSSFVFDISAIDNLASPGLSGNVIELHPKFY